ADAGVWKKGSAPYKLVKMLEDRGVREAASVVVLTERMRDWLVTSKGVPRDKVKVIPCCVDLSRYDSGSEVRDGFEVIYAGSVTGLY
ncbi:glycosyltransferase, partial [Escherichia coli]|nr:glycosyltransferase [Escherichia coli]